MAITELLQQILSARYGKDVRQSIHDAIKTCYDDGKAGATDLEAREALNNFKFKTENTVKKVYNPATQNWENFGGGGGGASTWSEIENKPFDTVGAGLDVKNNALIVNENITKELNDLGDDVEQINKDLNGFAFKTEGTEKKVYNPTTEAWEDFGSSASTWGDIDEKPFDTIGDGLKVESNVLKADVEPYELPIASTTILGGVKADGTTTTIDADGTIHAIGGGSADLSIIADEWSNTKAYSANDYVLYNDKQYKCLLANSNIVPTNTTYWADTTVGNELTQLNNDLVGLADNSMQFINVDDKIHTMTGRGAIWTATDNCWCIAEIRKDNDYSAFVYLNDIRIYGVEAVTMGIFVTFPVKKGQIVKTRAEGGTYSLEFYKM